MLMMEKVTVGTTNVPNILLTPKMCEVLLLYQMWGFTLAAEILNTEMKSVTKIILQNQRI